MSTADQINLAVAILAAVSVILNVLQFVAQRRAQLSDLRVSELKGPLKDLRTALKATGLRDINPDEEQWRHGFTRLDELVGIAAAAETAVRATRPHPRALQVPIHELLVQIRKLRRFADDYRTHAHGRAHEPDALIQQSWPGLSAAKVELGVFQTRVDAALAAIDKYLWP